MSKLIKPPHYHALLDMKQTERGIKQIKDFFQQNLSTELRLRRVTAPLFVLKGLGIAIISTSKGVMTAKQARAEHVGGEVLAFVW